MVVIIIFIFILDFGKVIGLSRSQKVLDCYEQDMPPLPSCTFLSSPGPENNGLKYTKSLCP